MERAFSLFRGRLGGTVFWSLGVGAVVGCGGRWGWGDWEYFDFSRKLQYVLNLIILHRVMWV